MKDVLRPLLKKFVFFAKDNLKFEKPPRLFLKQDSENQKCALGKTAHYDPQERAVTLYISGRHPKDIIRSFAHELVHHCQNERGDLAPEKMKTMTKNYAQENDHMRKMEQEAYLMGNMCFRDWEDGLDDKLQYKMSLAEQKFLKENKTMSVKITKQFLKETIEKLLSERVKRDSEDRVGGRRNGGRRVKPLEEKETGTNVKDLKDTSIEIPDLTADLDLKPKEPSEKGKNSAELEAYKTLVYHGTSSGGQSRARSRARAVDPKLSFADSKKLVARLAQQIDAEKMMGNTKQPKAQRMQEESTDAFAPSHYCIHHGGVQHEGKTVKAEAVQHVEPDENGFISHYDMKLEDGTILENVSAEDIQVTEASLAEKHGKREHGKMKKKCPCGSGKPKAECCEKKDVDEAKKKKAKPDYLDLDGDGNRKESMKKAAADKKKKKKKANESVIQTPEQEKALYESRFTGRNTSLYEKLLKEWTK